PKAAAGGMAFPPGTPSAEGLMRNRYVGRTFIEGTADRAAKARLKYTPLPEVLAGKRVLLVEDSIVRSTTMRALVHEIRDRGGAREIHLRVACPPIIAPCFYGIDMSRKSELFATPFLDLPGGGVSATAQQRMARELGADSLRYLPVEAIAPPVSLPAPAAPRPPPPAPPRPPRQAPPPPGRGAPPRGGRGAAPHGARGALGGAPPRPAPARAPPPPLRAVAAGPPRFRITGARRWPPA